jgi:hypothetical protein
MHPSNAGTLPWIFLPGSKGSQKEIIHTEYFFFVRSIATIRTSVLSKTYKQQFQQFRAE